MDLFFNCILYFVYMRGLGVRVGCFPGAGHQGGPTVSVRVH